ncbi:MAG: hypothetical protein L6Q33_13480, partial [Bacteriovoracaceae bacterium]|nr:hypothetical protein [Bacteriovoracaceae bacterium]
MSGHDYTSELRKPLITLKRSYGQITDDVLKTIEGPPSTAWYVAFTIAVLTLIMGIVVVIYQLRTGIGTWGLNKTIGWSWDITNFVFWVGIGHAGTFISAILLLFRQKWRTSINRAAEAMTIIAVCC